MITEDYVSLETAKFLEEKGFDEPVLKFYDHKGEVAELYYRPQNKSITGDTYKCPTIQMAMKWFEEKYGVFCVIRRHGNIDDGFTYSWNCEGKMGLSVGNGGGFKIAAEACEAAIRYTLEKI